MRLDRDNYVTSWADASWWDELPISLKSKRRLRRVIRLCITACIVLGLLFAGGSIGFWLGAESARLEAAHQRSEK